MHYVYILRSIKDSTLYIGQTKDLKKRFDRHNSGVNLATHNHIPYELVFYSGFKNIIDALNAERYYKTTSGWKRIHRMLTNTLA